MSKVIIVFLLLSLSSLLLLANETNVENSISRYAFIVGKNYGGKGRVELKYANSDAKEIADVFQAIGGVDSENVFLLREPTKNSLTETFKELRRKITSQEKGRKEVVFYYSGHSNEEGLLLGDEIFLYRDLKKMINSLSADVQVIVLDSCSSGSFTTIKGGHKRPSFLTENLSKLKGHVFLTSSSSTESSQESDTIRGSYFTHYLAQGLRGAADFSKDKKITVNEAYQYAYYETLKKTENTMEGAQHPSYSISLNGRGELVLTDLRIQKAKIVFSSEIFGHILIKNSQNKLVFELDKGVDHKLELPLESGIHTVYLTKGNNLYSLEVRLENNKERKIDIGEFKTIKKESTVTRGDNEYSEITKTEDAPAFNVSDLKHKTAIVGVTEKISTNEFEGFNTHTNLNAKLFQSNIGFVDGLSFVPFGISKIKYGLRGANISLASINEGDLTGFDLGIVSTIKSRFGLSIGVLTIADNSYGLNIGGLNIADHYYGFNIGGLNIFKNFYGVELGGVNYANYLAGVQLGGVNYSKKFKGLQFGLFNIASEESSCQIGLLNYSQDLAPVQFGLLNFGRDNEISLYANFSNDKFYELAIATGRNDLKTYFGFGYKVRGFDNFKKIEFGTIKEFRGNRFSFTLAPTFQYKEYAANSTFLKMYGDNASEVNFLIRAYPSIRVFNELYFDLIPEARIRMFGDTNSPDYFWQQTGPRLRERVYVQDPEFFKRKVFELLISAGLHYNFKL